MMAAPTLRRLLYTTLLCLAAGAALAQPYRNLTLEQAIERLQSAGLHIYYSSDLIKPWMRVREEPASADPRDILASIVAPYELAVQDGPDDTLLLVRAVPAAVGQIAGIVRRTGDGLPVRGAAVLLVEADRRTTTNAGGRFEFDEVPAGRYRVRLEGSETEEIATQIAEVGARRTTRLSFTTPHAPAPPQLEEIVVNASQYAFVRMPAPSLTSLSATDLQLVPDVGDDPLRAVARLPGAASGDFSAKSNIRGGEVDETLVRFDDLRLFNPFHFKDFQSAFSTIDPRIVSEIDIYTGGFPAAYGDRMSSVIDIASLRQDEAAYRELSLSFFNASALAAGRFDRGNGDWLLSARRGNLDLLFDLVEPALGKPSYFDSYGRLGYQLTDALAVSANFLVFDDDIDVSDNDREELAQADYRDEYYWLRMDYEPNDVLAGRLLVARSELASRRVGSAVKPGVTNGSLDDQRAFSINSLQTDWSWQWTERLLWQFGAEWRNARGEYLFRDDVELELLFDVPGAPTQTSRARRLQLRPKGSQSAAYANLRVDVSDDLVAEAGLRWDKETLSPGQEDQFSPRVSLLYHLGERTRLRASWGRFFQAQSIHELQIADGVTRFFPAQRSDHLVLSAEYQLTDAIGLRLEAYRKDYAHLAPRYENLLNAVVLLPELRPDRIRIAPDQAIARGAELSLRRQGDDPLSWWISYSWSSVEDEFGTSDVLRAWDQKHSAGAGIAWQGPRWEFSVAGTYHTGWPVTPVELGETEPIPIAVAGPRNSERLAAYERLDVRIARKFQFERAGRLTVFLEVTNVLDKTNQCCTDYQIEDEIVDEVFLDIERVKYLSVLPSLGFIWQF